MSKSPAAILYDSDGANPVGTPTHPIRTDPTGTTAQPVSMTSLPLPTGAASEVTLAAIKDTDGIKKITDPLPAGTNEIGKVAQGTKGAAADAWPVVLYDASGNPISVVLDGGVYRVRAEAQIQTQAKGTTSAGFPTSEALDANRQALHVKMIGGGSGVGANVNIVDSSGNDIATADGSAPAGTKGLMVEGYESAGAVARRLAVDSQGRLVTAPAGAVAYQAGFASGDVALASITNSPVNRTAYVEQTTNGQRSVASASANDTAAGTGARQVRITYLDQTGAGPYTEVVTLNGTTGVNTAASNICLIEKIEVISVGSGGVNAGIITLYTAINKGGTAIGTIAASDNRTFWNHHYVPSGKTCYVTSVACSSNSSVAGNGSIHTLRAHSVPSGNAPLVQISDFVFVYGQSSNVSRNFGTPVRVPGPAHIEGWVTTFVNSSITYRSSFDYYDQ